jgi:citrate lyase subunit beta / citryl-CoA lyase
VQLPTEPIVPPSALHPRRSVLFVPGDNPRALEKARDLPADGLIFDLEDAVAPATKTQARAQISHALQQGGYGRRERIVRVNALETPWGAADLAAVAAMPIDAVLLPKIERPDQVHRAQAVLDRLGAPAGLAIWCMLETPRGVLAGDAIATASPRLAALVAGTSDLTTDLHATVTPDRAPLLISLGLIVLAARAHGLAALDGVHLDLADDGGFALACRQGRTMGFDGKTLIHPRQIAPANAAFAPSAAEVAWSQRVVVAHAEAEAQGSGLVVLDGRLVENLHVAEARRIFAIAAAIADIEQQPAAGR